MIWQRCGVNKVGMLSDIIERSPGQVSLSKRGVERKKKKGI